MEFYGIFLVFRIKVYSQFLKICLRLVLDLFSFHITDCSLLLNGGRILYFHILWWQSSCIYVVSVYKNKLFPPMQLLITSKLLLIVCSSFLFSQWLKQWPKLKMKLFHWYYNFYIFVSVIFMPQFLLYIFIPFNF